MLAVSIGWPPDNPFQTEVGIANLALGSVGVGWFWHPGWFVPAALGRGTFVGGAGILHITELVRADNTSPGNAGAVLYWDMIRFATMLPLALLHLRWCSQHAAGEAVAVEAARQTAINSRLVGWPVSSISVV